MTLTQICSKIQNALREKNIFHRKLTGSLKGLKYDNDKIIKQQVERQGEKTTTTLSMAECLLQKEECMSFSYFLLIGVGMHS